MRLFLPLLLVGCAGEFAFEAPTIEGLRQVVPGEGTPPEAEVMDANNNLDLAQHDGRWFLAWRTAPSHFASDQVLMHVASSDDRQTWTWETTISLQTDVREPQLVSWDGELTLYFAVLGTSLTDFEPQGTQKVRRLGPGEWTTPEASEFPDTFIPWRIKPMDGRLHLLGYAGGENVYDFANREPIEVSWLVSDDAETWEPAVAGQPVVLSGGVSETDMVRLDDGTLIAVARNEAGDEDGFGSKICRAEADDLGTWTCVSDPKKYDSPLLFRHGDDVWLIGRRNLTDTGHYDLMQAEGDNEDRYLAYQWDYWHNPKRCALWAVDPETLTVHHAADLPSRGDTCFPEMVELTEDEFLVYNYSSPVDGPDLDWLDGQTGVTHIYEQRLVFP
ncbi:MAG: exo-alpha-sialidase [Deltaproteobacteria bacterium]|nr:MAG: exo-alpha-sialidase [Deltaproteobacteria bacterium]